MFCCSFQAMVVSTMEKNNAVLYEWNVALDTTYWIYARIRDRVDRLWWSRLRWQLDADSPGDGYWDDAHPFSLVCEAIDGVSR